MTKNFTNLLVLLSYIVVSYFSFSYYFNNEGFVGINHDWNIPPLPEQMRQRILQGLYTWDDTKSISLAMYHTRLYYNLFESLLTSLVGFNGTLVSKIIIPLLMCMASFSMFLLGRQLGFSLIPSFTMGLFYILNPLFYNKVLAGHIFYLFSYSISPIVLLFLVKYLFFNKIKYLILASIIVAISSAQIQFPFLLFISILLFLLLFYKIYLGLTILNLFYKLLRDLVILTVIYLMINAYWILPALHSSSVSILSSIVPIDYHDIIAAPNTILAFLIIGYPHIYDPYYLWKSGILNSFSIISLIIVVVSTSYVFIFTKQKYHKMLSIYSALLLLIGVFMVSAINGPFPPLWKTLYLKGPLLLFRETYHAAFLITFAYSLLLGLLLESSKKRLIISIIIITLITIAGFPVLNSYMHVLQNYNYTNSEIYIYKRLVMSDNYYRVLYIPSLSPMKYPGLYNAGIDIWIEYSPKPTFPQLVFRQYPLETLVQYYTLTAIENPTKLTYLHTLFSKIGVKYIICRHMYISMYPNYVPMQYYLQKVYNNSALYTHWFDTFYICKRILESSNNNKIINVSNDTFMIQLDNRPFVYTCDNILLTSSFSELLSVVHSFDDVSCALLLRYDDPSFSLFVHKGLSKFFILKSTLNDLTLAIASSLNGSKILKFVSAYRDVNAHWSNTAISWYIHPEVTLCLLQGDCIVTYATNATLKTSFRISTEGEYKIFIRALNSKTSGTLLIEIDDNYVTLNTRGFNESFIWYDVGTFSFNAGTHNIQIRNINGLNAINLVLIVPLENIRSASALIDRMIKEGNLKLLNISQKNNYNVTYSEQTNSIIVSSNLNVYLEVSTSNKDQLYLKKINPTLWIVKINLTKPSLLVFAEGYDAQWIAEVYNSSGELVNVVSSVPVYGVINGFWINATGNLKILIKYRPQELFDIGLYISYGTFIVLFIYILLSYINVNIRKIIVDSIKNIL